MFCCGREFCSVWLLSHVQLCDPMDYSPLGSSVHGIFKARIPDWFAIPFSRGSSQCRDRAQVSCIAGGFFTTRATREAPVYCWGSVNYSYSY